MFRNKLKKFGDCRYITKFALKLNVWKKVC